MLGPKPQASPGRGDVPRDLGKPREPEKRDGRQPKTRAAVPYDHRGDGALQGVEGKEDA